MMLATLFADALWRDIGGQMGFAAAVLGGGNSAYCAAGRWNKALDDYSALPTPVAGDAGVPAGVKLARKSFR